MHSALAQSADALHGTASRTNTCRWLAPLPAAPVFSPAAEPKPGAASSVAECPAGHSSHCTDGPIPVDDGSSNGQPLLKSALQAGPKVAFAYPAVRLWQVSSEVSWSPRLKYRS